MPPTPPSSSALVDGDGPDAQLLRGLLAREGWELRTRPPVEVAFVDPWTPENADWVTALRQAGTRLSCVADLVLARTPVPVIGITGTAGKSSTSWILRALLARDGREVHAAESATGQLWPTCELLGVERGLVLAELTSSHLCFMERSPSVAVVTSFWPDHVELHGSLDAYRSAKERIARFQTRDDLLVLPWDDPGTDWLRDVGDARRAWFAETDVPDGAGDGVFTRDGVVIARRGDDEAVVGVLDAPRFVRRNALAAAAAASCLGVPAAVLGAGLSSPELPPHRARTVGTVAGVPVIDDTMAATPAKTRAALALYADRSILLVAGGRSASDGGPVHATPEEQALLEKACTEAQRVARCVILFGDAAGRLAALLDGVPTETVGTIQDGLARAFEVAAAQSDLAAVLVSPMFPLAQQDRALVAAMAGALAARYAPEVETEEAR